MILRDHITQYKKMNMLINRVLIKKTRIEIINTEHFKAITNNIHITLLVMIHCIKLALRLHRAFLFYRHCFAMVINVTKSLTVYCYLIYCSR
jgi:short-subunit dehydrogenase involved in D-alanine esterification of teichoic acids